MAEIMFPLENTDYSAADAQLWFATRTSGVYTNGHLAVIEGNGMNVIVDKGIAWLHYGEFAGAVYGNTMEVTLQVAISDAIYPRIDRVVIRYDAVQNKGFLTISPGVPASAPAAPELTRNENAYEISLAQIHVGAGVTEITAANITDERLDETVCGLMRDGVTGIDTSMILNQAIASLENVRKDANAILAEINAAYNNAISGTLAVDLQNAVNKKAEKFHATAVIGTSWTSGAAYMQTISVPGILATDTPIIDLVASDNAETAENEIAAWAVIYRIDTENNQIKVYASEATTQAITIQILGVR